jgi:hypothetical protein
MQTTTSEHYKPAVRFGLGGVPLGNEFAVITEKDAYATLEAAWSAGVRFAAPNSTWFQRRSQAIPKAPGSRPPRDDPRQGCMLIPVDPPG